MFHRDEISLEEIVDEAASWSIDEDSFTEEDVQLILNHMEVSDPLALTTLHEPFTGT
jgi:NACalpha-BTF3-like transcription factor